MIHVRIYVADRLLVVQFVGEWSLREWSEQTKFVLPSGGGKGVAATGDWGGGEPADDAESWCVVQ